MFKGRPKEPRPPALPPETRPIGQLIAESIRLYGSRFWRSFALGIGPAVMAVGITYLPGWWDVAFVVSVGALLMSASYVGGFLLAAGERPSRRRLAIGFAVAYVLMVPAIFLWSVLLLPAVIWLGVLGLAVPAALLEGRGPLDSLRRGIALARVDPIHAIGSLAALVIVAFLTATTLFVLLRGGSQIALSSSAFVSLLFISPLLFLGSGLLYFDQAARLASVTRPRRPDADLHHAHEPDRPGRPDPEGEPRPATGSQP
jgi:hypothetical protein